MTGKTASTASPASSSWRGLIRGVWRRNLEADPGWPGMEEEFRSGGFVAPIDVAALRADPDRFHLYVAHPCPFAHRVVMIRAFLGLESIGMSICHPWLGGPDGWHFAPHGGRREGYADLTEDRLFGARALHQIYARADSSFTGRVTVPVLFDRMLGTIASNDSFAIALALLAAFDPEGKVLGIPAIETGIKGPATDPDATLRRLGERPLALAKWVADEVTLGVYRAGMARDQESYEAAARAFFVRLDGLERLLARSRGPLLRGDRPGFADLVLFATLVRLEPAYAGALYLTLRRLADYPRLSLLLKLLMRDPRVAATVHLDQIARHYFDDDAFVNRAQSNGRYIVPLVAKRRVSQPAARVA